MDAGVARSAYEIGLERQAANHVPLSPLSFLRRAARVHPDRVALVDGRRRLSWAEVYDRCRRLAAALHQRGIGRNDTVAIIATNVPAMYEAHFGVPMAGAVLNAINTRLDAAAIAFMLDHGEAKLLLATREFAELAAAALALTRGRPELVVIDDAREHAPAGYEAMLAGADPGFDWSLPADEWDAIALSYTSGTTGNPKGVVTHHRGAYLAALGNALAWNLGDHPTYLWTLPMFHCNGWCFPWALAAVAGTSVCQRKVGAKAIFDAIADEGVDHFCAAPTVLAFIIDAAPEDRRRFDRVVKVMTAGSAPPAPVLAAMTAAGFAMTHVYGLTEVYGPAVICAWKPHWDSLSADEQARLKARQGVPYPVLEDVAVVDPATLAPVARDGETIGEVVLRGNIVMKGYFKNPAATAEALAGGWFRCGDLGVMHQDGYVEIKDRAKDIIISGGENISSLEVESVLYQHHAVVEAAVVACPDRKWGETPCAFITLRAGAQVEQRELIAFCRERLAHFKVPRTIVFGPLPKTATGKIQKRELRTRAQALAALL